MSFAVVSNPPEFDSDSQRERRLSTASSLSSSFSLASQATEEEFIVWDRVDRSRHSDYDDDDFVVLGRESRADNERANETQAPVPHSARCELDGGPSTPKETLVCHAHTEPDGGPSTPKETLVCHAHTEPVDVGTGVTPAIPASGQLRVDSEPVQRLTIAVSTISLSLIHDAGPPPSISKSDEPLKKKKKKRSKKAKKLGIALAKNGMENLNTGSQDPPVKVKVKKRKAKATQPLSECKGLGSRSVVDDLSTLHSPVDGETMAPSLYQEASEFISSYLSNPEAKSSMVYRLTLLQSLIIELGLTTMASALPRSLTAAKSLLKSRAFLNIKEYISVRGQGQEAIRKILYPSRNALRRDILKKKNAAPIQWVKDHGLQVLLVSRF